MEADELKLIDREYDYLKKLVTEDIQRTIVARDNNATLDRAGLLLKLIKLHAYERRVEGKQEAIVDHEPETVGGKTCTSCGVTKEITSFHKNPQCKDGRNTICKACVSLYNKNYNKKKKENEVNK